MWELRQMLSHGRISLRRFSLLANAFMLAFFTVAAFLSTPVYADGATRSQDGKTVTYQSNTYAVLSPQQIPPAVANTTPPTSGYGSFDIANHKAYLILTSGDATTANNGQYVVYDFNPPNEYKNGTSPQEVTLTTDGSHSGAKGASNCSNSETGAIGWIICPVVTFLAKGMDYIYGIIAQFLEVKTVSADTHSSLYQMWSFVRDIANICFVIGFLIIIFSQITNLGISNYGIKSALPRLIIAAILVNISYTVCAAAVDISNILGQSIHGLFVGLMERFNTGAGYDNTGSFDMPDWSMVAAAILTGAGTILGVGVAVYTGAIFLLLPTLVGAIIAALVALIILATRQALIIIMIIIAPLAFVAYLLPNTEKYFDKWRDAFMTLLLLFPIFSIVFSGAQLAGMAIVQNAGGNLVMIILGMAVQVAPLFVTPLLLKFSGGIIGKVAGIVNNPNKGLIDRTRNWATGRAQERKNKVLTDHNNSRASHRFNPARRTAVALDTRRRRIEGRRKAYESMADNRFAATRQGQDIEAMNRSAANEKQRVENVFAGSARGRQLELQSRHLGVQKQEIENSMLNSDAGRHLTYRQHMADVQKTVVSNNFEESHLGHQVDTAKREAERTKQRIEADHEQAWHFRTMNNQDALEGEMKLRASVDKAAVRKAAVENAYSELKAGDISKFNIQTDTLRDLATATHKDAFEGMALAAAKVQADSDVQSKYAEEILKATSEQVRFDHLGNKSLRDVATGVGKDHTALANAAAKYRADWGKETQAQMELMKHYKIDAGMVANMSLGRTVGDDGNPINFEIHDKEGRAVFTFDPTDEYTKDAAIERIAQIGSHDQKVAVVEETGERINVYDKSGNAVFETDEHGNFVLDGQGNKIQVTRKGYTYDHRGTVNSVMKDFGGIAPGLRDKSIDAEIQGKFNGHEDTHYHTMRQILEGRIKAGDLASANPASLKIILMGDDEGGDVHRNALNRLINDTAASEEKRLLTLRSTNPTDPEVAGLSDADIAAKARSIIEQRMANRRRDVIEMADTVLTNTNVSRDTTGDSMDLIRRFLAKQENAAALGTIRSQQRTERRR